MFTMDSFVEQRISLKFFISNGISYTKLLTHKNFDKEKGKVLNNQHYSLKEAREVEIFHERSLS